MRQNIETETLLDTNSFVLPEEDQSSFGLPDEDENSLESVTNEPVTHEPDNPFGFHMIGDPENQCLYGHFDRFDSTDNGKGNFCYYLQNEKSYDQVFEVCAYHEYHSHMDLLRETHFRLAKGKTNSKTSSE